MLTPEQIKSLKEQLSAQVQHLSPEQKVQAQAQIDSMSPETLESFVKEQQQKVTSPNSKDKTIYRMIIDKEVKSVNIAENKKALSVLEINPASPGHSIIIPKISCKDAKSVPTQAFALAKKVSQQLISKLKAKSTIIQTENKFGETIINVIPSYNEDETIDISSPRKRTSLEDLEKIGEKIRIVKKEKKPIIRKTKSKSIDYLKMRRRVP